MLPPPIFFIMIYRWPTTTNIQPIYKIYTWTVLVINVLASVANPLSLSMVPSQIWALKIGIFQNITIAFKSAHINDRHLERIVFLEISIINVYC